MLAPCINLTNSLDWTTVHKLNELADKRVLLEVDEQQHKSDSYSLRCDNARMSYVMTAIACYESAETSVAAPNATGEGERTPKRRKTTTESLRPTLWLRFNPNAYRVDGIRLHVPKKVRYARLLHVLQNYVPSKTTEIMYMYFDEHTVLGTASSAASKELDILADPDYSRQLAQLVFSTGT